GWSYSGWLGVETKAVMLFFFFSSRRRHTRLVSDWSSDVCSSDLDLFRTLEFFLGGDSKIEKEHGVAKTRQLLVVPGHEHLFGERSEERRVGKEGRSRWWRYT